MKDQDSFTIDDAENDGLIKREGGQEATTQAKQHESELWTMFKNVCDDMGRPPEEVLGDHILKAIRSEQHARMLSGVDIDLSQINNDQLSIEDAKFIQNMMDSLGVDREQESDPIEQYMQDRLRSATQGPIGRMRGNKQTSDNSEVRQELDEIKQQINELADSQNGSAEGGSGRESKADIDEIVTEATENGSETNDGGDSGASDSGDTDDSDSGFDMTGEVEVSTVEETGGGPDTGSEFPTSEDATNE